MFNKFSLRVSTRAQITHSDWLKPLRMFYIYKCEYRAIKITHSDWLKVMWYIWIVRTFRYLIP